MRKSELESLSKLTKAMDNFKSCYGYDADVLLWGGYDAPVSAEELLCFLIENPHLQEIANEIALLRGKI